MLSAEKIDLPVSGNLNEQSMQRNEEAGQEAKNDFSELDDLSHAVRTPLHVLGGYVAELQKFSKGFNKLKMSDQALQRNLFLRPAKLGRYLSAIQTQTGLLTSGKYVEFFTRLSSEKSDRPGESSIAAFSETLASMADHINRLQAAQKKLKTLVHDFEKLNPEELKTQFDEIATEIQGIVIQIKKEVDDLNATISPAASVPPVEMRENNTPLRILIVDDISMNQKILGRLLGKQYCCEFANNGKEAVAKYLENDFDLIFMDIQMPVMDGIKATIAIREQELAKNKRRTPIIASTATDSETLDKGMAAGMDGYIMKPYSEKQVHEIINLHTESSEEVCSENESNIDDRPLTPTLSRKILRNDFAARSPAQWSAPSEGRERRRLLTRFHLLRHERERSELAQSVLPGSHVAPQASELRKSFL